MRAGNDPVCTEVSTVGDLLVAARSRAPDRDALVLPDCRLTYAQLHDAAIEAARGLLGLGVRPGEAVGLFMANSPEYVAAFFGALMLGCVVVPLNVRHKATELGYIIANADLVAILTSNQDRSYISLPEILVAALPATANAADPRRLALAEAPALRSIVNLGGPTPAGFLDADSFAAVAQTIDPAAVERARRAVRVRDVAIILYTSGTTANPKGCMLSHEAVTRGPLERARYRLKAPERDVTWVAGPLFHIGSLAPFIGSVGVAGTFLCDRFFDAGRAVHLMQDEGCTLAWPWFSAIVQGIIDHPDFDPRKLSKLRHLFLIAAPSLVDRVQNLLPDAEILQACGMTETAGVFALSDPDEGRQSRSETQGRASPGVDIRIVDPETGADCAPGRMGEIWVRGYCVMDGYFRNPEQTAAALDASGWLRTGDLYTRSAEGNLVFQGRLKDMLKVGGENVATMEVEAFLCSHPAVKIAEVVGRADPRLDEVPVAFVELRDGSEVTPDDLIGYCKGRIANYKIPRAIHFVAPADWPMSATKVDKRALRERLRTLSSEAG